MHRETLDNLYRKNARYMRLRVVLENVAKARPYVEVALRTVGCYDASGWIDLGCYKAELLVCRRDVLRQIHILLIGVPDTLVVD